MTTMQPLADSPKFMYDHNQLEIPDSFAALYLVRGRLAPGATRAVVGERYEVCEDLANQLEPYARAQHLDQGHAVDDVLLRCHRGLLAEASGVSAAEAGWVVSRIAEIADWPLPALDGASAADPG
jgi:hypothetical protein